jgi:hypothetical protein
MFRGIHVSILILPNSDAFDCSMALCIDFSHSFCRWGGSSRPDFMSHPVLEGKPNANHVRARISYSRTQQLHNMDIITQCSK